MAGSLTNVGTVSAAEPTEITFWHYMSEDKEGKFVNEAIEEFNNSQDEVHVTAQYLPREELMKQYTIGVVSGELPDCGMVDNPDHASYASMGVFEDITDLYNSWDEADFMEGSINSCYYDDKLYGLPWGNNCLGLFYNKSMLEEAGVEVPTTWSELEAACERSHGIYWKVPSSFPIAEIARPLQVSVVSFSHAASNSDKCRNGIGSGAYRDYFLALYVRRQRR